MLTRTILYLFTCFAILISSSPKCSAEVLKSGPDGFHIQLEAETQCAQDVAFLALVKDFGKWWDATHSYSGKPENISIDIERQCFYEKLEDGGFVRHMEIVFYQPRTATIRFSGGLGPLQEMGVDGALTMIIEKPVPVEGESEAARSTAIRWTYLVNGASHQALEQLAPIVDQVLHQQLEHLKKHCDKLAR